MITKISLQNFGRINKLECSRLGKINLVIGPNQSGKTTLLKALYAAIRTVELFRRGDNNKSDKEILSEKLWWTFQTRSLSNLVTKGASTLSFSMSADHEQEFRYTFGTSTTKAVQKLDNTFRPRSTNSIFIPAKEILSIQDIVIDSRNRYSEFGFEEPYVDLANAILPTTKGKNYKSFSDARMSISEMVGGKLDFDSNSKKWMFVDNNRRIYDIGMTSEGVKKLSILELLLGNHYLSNESVILIDEVEANLHPFLVSKFLDTVITLSFSGVQFFIASHSYFVIKKLYIEAQRRGISIPVISFDNETCTVDDLGNGMPKNAIIDESINLYKEEVSL